MAVFTGVLGDALLGDLELGGVPTRSITMTASVDGSAALTAQLRAIVGMLAASDGVGDFPDVELLIRQGFFGELLDGESTVDADLTVHLGADLIGKTAVYQPRVLRRRAVQQR